VEDHPRNKTVVTVVSPMVDQPPPTEACLVVICGQDLGKKHSLDAPVTLLGRSASTAIQIDQESVSRNHAQILNSGGSVVLRDLGSTNGTYVNDQRIEQHALRDGDFITIGRTIFKFLTGGNVENAYHEEIYRLTTIDGLTQVYNKRYFLEALEREISRAHRHRRHLSLALFDIDHFKRVNDSFGHLAGDHVLRSLAGAVKANLRREDLLARYGGEEFAIILPEVDAVSARLIADKLRRLVEETRFVFEGTPIPATISLGIASWRDEITDAQQFIKLTDERLYEAKQLGRNRVC
jgi:diguanylate cyclase (GGDEF)-like protein